MICINSIFETGSKNKRVPSTKESFAMWWVVAGEIGEVKAVSQFWNDTQEERRLWNKINVRMNKMNESARSLKKLLQCRKTWRQMMTTITWWAVPRKMTLLYWKWNWHFPFLKLHQKTKGVNHAIERGYHMRLQNNTHEMTHEKIKMKHSRCFLEQETRIAQYWLVPGTDHSVMYNRIIAFS